MPITIVDPRGGFVKARWANSPVVILETDADTVESLPCGLRCASNSYTTGDLKSLRSLAVPRDADAVVTWLIGESILSGSLAAIRHDLRIPGRCTFVPIHVPCLEELPLIGIQPRWMRIGRQQNCWNVNFRIQSAGRASPLLMEALTENREAWAQLSVGIFAESARAGTGIATLVRLWERAKELQHAFAALVLRNLAVVMLRHGETARAEQFLEAGMKLYSGYAELFYLAAWHAIREQRAGQAFPLLERAKSRECGGFLGCGGESTYRVDWLLGCLAARIGNERKAFEHFLHGMHSHPVFVPAVEELLELRVSKRLVEAHRWQFFHAARREPRLAERIFDYLLLHRALDAAQHILRTMPMHEATRARLEERLAGTSHAPKAGETHRSKPCVDLIGPFFEHTSLARINREIAGAVLGHNELNARLEPSTPGAVPPRMFANGIRLHAAFSVASQQPALTIRHQWPPDFRRPATGKLAAIVPWEYGAVPQVWVTQIERNVDELWVPSRFVRDVFVRGGVTAERMHVIPNGVDTTLFAMEGPASRPAACRNFVFLFFGGAIRRKGVDVLVEAFQAAFDAGDDVSLLLAVSGGGGAYMHNSLIRKIQRAANDSRRPQVQMITDEIDDATLASLYRGCDAFVLPYRGEGFALPLLEAMACGKPVITTARGPSEDFCAEHSAYLVSAREEIVPDEPPPLGKLTGPFTWFEPDFAELVRTQRHVYEHREEAAQRGLLGARHVRRHFGWPRITQMYLDRIGVLTKG